MTGKVPVYDKQGRKIGERGGDHSGERDVFVGRPGGLGALAAASKAKRDEKARYESPIAIKSKKKKEESE